MNKILKTFIIIFILGCNNTSLKSSNSDKADVEPYPTNSDTLKIKNGLILEDNGLKEIYYYNGKKNGVFKSYYKINGKLEGLGFYENDIPVGIWYYFNEKGEILMIEDKKGLNKDKKVKRDDGVMIKPIHESYLKLYDPKSGMLKREGIILYFEDIEIEYFEYGNWITY